MRAVVQRVRHARVDVGGETVGKIGPGLLILLGVGTGDGHRECVWLADRVAKLRIFPDDAGKMNLDVRTVGGSVLVVSQFTLYGDCTSGRRPGFSQAARPEVASPLVNQFVEELVALGVPVATGRFGADMQVELVNDGPVTLIMDTPLKTSGNTPVEGELPKP
jgi:D-tyrosyl-tRNA(Tyr) deacylase